MSSMSYNSVYTPAAMFRQPFTSPSSLHANGTTTSATSSSPYYHHPQIPMNDHQQQMVSHPLQQASSQSTAASAAQQWPSADKRDFNNIFQPGSSNNSVSFPFASSYQSTNG
ncbi:7936_t:CDS:1 [Acaulospora colombiana]|uniref:7936_t:CDS:1 n=1 Tax=Acaulospora colombiana TaxID=27376 RepID=A0ACA9N2D8_9GLOM|nr:7936_t:CDS:1 [Acaulospora colombiana]